MKLQHFNIFFAITTAFAVLLIFNTKLLAEEKTENQKRGLVTSTTCPYTCKMAGLPSETCREYQIGESCIVEDLTQAPGHRSLIRVPATNKSHKRNIDSRQSLMRREIDGTWITVNSRARLR